MSISTETKLVCASLAWPCRDPVCPGSHCASDCLQTDRGTSLLGLIGSSAALHDAGAG